MGEKGSRKNSQSFVNQIVKRAKSMVAPDKYSIVNDWKRTARSQPRGKMAKARKLTMTAEIIENQKKSKRPGPQSYQQWIKPKAKGFYKPSDTKYSIVPSIAYSKKGIPGPTIYKGRGKDMFERMKSGTTTIRFGVKHEAPPENLRLSKIRKDGKPGPASFEVGKSLDACALPQPVNQKMNQAKNVNCFERVTKQKRIIPGVGSYKTDKAFDAISGGPPCYARKR